jgi:MFS family permease
MTPYDLTYRHRVLGVLCLLAMVTYVDRVCISVAGTTNQKGLGLTSQQWGWVLGAFALSYGLSEVPSGAIGDRIGPPRVLARIVTWCSAFTALMGQASDRLVRRFGLTWGRRWIGLVGLLCAAVFTGATWCTQYKGLTVLFLALGYAGSDFMLPVAWAVCLDVGGRHAGSVNGAMNMAGQAASFLSSVTFGYIVRYAGDDWNAPLVPMTVTALLAALCWLKISANRPPAASQT